MDTWLACVCGCQGNWDDAESILVPIAMAKGAVDLMAFHGMTALAQVHLATGNYGSAIKYGKRAAWGMRRLEGKTSNSF
jgi:hypothetical protein